MSSGLHIQSVTRGPQLEHVRSLLREYNAHLITFIDPDLLRHRETELASLPATFLPPTGALLLATRDAQPLGCAALRQAPITSPGTLDPTRTAEFCRLWVTAAARGQELGRHLLHEAIHLARAAGYTTLVLNSISGFMPAAQHLYDRAGFHPIPPYKLVAIPHAAFFALSLTP